MTISNKKIKRLYQVPIEETETQIMAKKISNICGDIITEALSLSEETGEDPYNIID